MFGTRRAKKGHLIAIDNELIDQLLAQHGHRPEDIVGETGLLKKLTKALLGRVMQAEMTHHLGYEKHDPGGYKSCESRNGNSKKTLSGEFGEVQLETPRDRKGSFDPNRCQASDALHGFG